MKIVLASNNRGKLGRIAVILAPLGVQLIAQGDLFAGEAPEPHCTFVENALAKARFAAEKTGCPPLPTMRVCAWMPSVACPGVQTAYYCTQFGYEKAMPTMCKPCWSNWPSSPAPPIAKGPWSAPWWACAMRKTPSH